MRIQVGDDVFSKVGQYRAKHFAGWILIGIIIAAWLIFASVGWIAYILFFAKG